MYYRKYKPSAVLQPYVDSFYIWESEHSLLKPFSINSHANGCTAIVFNYGDLVKLFNPVYLGIHPPRAFLCPPSTESYTLQVSGFIGMAGIIFKGGAYRRFFLTPFLGDLLNQRICMEDLIGNESNEILNQLAEAGSTQARLRILEGFLISHLHANHKDSILADRAAAMILESRGMIRMDELANRLHIGSRQLRRAFKNRVGISPKYFARLKRFSYVNLSLTRNGDLSWKRFIQDDGFYDQSHFIKDYHEFFGKVPSEQILQNREMASILSA